MLQIKGLNESSFRSPFIKSNPGNNKLFRPDGEQREALESEVNEGESQISSGRSC